jgi:hypothetical protein
MEMVVGCAAEAGPVTAKAGTVKLVAMYCVRPPSIWPAGKYMELTSASWRELSDGWAGSGAFFGLAELLGRRREASPVGRLRLQACPTGGELEIEDRELEVEDDLHVGPTCK